MTPDSMRMQLRSSRDEEDRITLRSPGVGRWHQSPEIGEVVRAGKPMGTLQVLGRAHVLVVPDGVSGVVIEIADRYDVEFDQVLAILGDELNETTALESVKHTTSDGALVFTSSSSGRYYSRPSPDKPAFVNVGDEIEIGQIVFLLEVMKTFSRVAYGGDAMPARARVVRILPADGDDLEPGQAVLELEAI